MPSIAPEAKTVELPLTPDIGRALWEHRPQLCATDAHRLALQAKLTEIAVPPFPGDRGALRQLAGLDTESVDAVVRWLSHAAGVPYSADGRFLAAEPPLTAPRPAEPPLAEPPLAEAPIPERPLVEAPPCVDAPPVTTVPTHPADRMDPRLIAW